VRRQKKKMVKPNLIPIMDAVFIFIFFLLMSAQFLEIYEIGSDAPAVMTLTEKDRDKKPPLNLTLEVTKSEITVKTGLAGTVYRKIASLDGNYDIRALNKALSEIKFKNPTEDSVIIKPDAQVEYKKLVWIMDTCRAIPEDAPAIALKTPKGDATPSRELFSQIIFETVL
jgi:biopolymer transport protein ExbD